MRTRALFSALSASALASIAAAACGGSTDTPRPAPAPLCRPIVPLSDTPDLGGGAPDCSALDGYELLLLNDFEVGSSVPGYYVNNDRTADQDPLPDSDPAPSSTIPGGRCLAATPSAANATLCASAGTPRGACTTPFPLQSRSAIHIRSGLLTNNGGVFGHSLPRRCVPVDEAPACPFTPGPPEVGPCSVGLGPSPPRRGCHAVDDMSSWDGLVLWARKGPGSASSIRVRASDERTDDKACICNSFTNQNDTSTGCDKFGRFVTLDETWRAYFVPFSEMQQGGWGLKSPGLQTDNLFEIAIEYGRGAWDLWIDDIALYRTRP